MIWLKAIPWRLVGIGVAALAIVGFIWWGARIVGKANERDAAVAAREEIEGRHSAYKSMVQGMAMRAIARMERDQADDAAMAARITQLQVENAELARIAASVPATVETPDANGVPRLSINGDWWLCLSPIITRDPADTAACKARAGARAPEH